MNQKYPKRLIEVDLPIRRISAHARREKSIRHGHISTLHMWWARRPLAACRAVICASLWPDPADPLCPQSFRDRAAKIIYDFASAAVRSKELGESCDKETWYKWKAMAERGTLDSHNEAHWNILRFALLDFIADFANWDNAIDREYLEISHALTQAAHESVGGEPGTRPMVVDPFAGGGSIPLEALRVGADAFATDLNPVPVLLNKVVLEYIPKYGQRLADEVRKWGDWIKQEAEKELADLYPKDPDGATPIAYIWARTIRCDGPKCGAEVPLLRSLWLAKKANHQVALQIVPNQKMKRVEFQILTKDRGEWRNQDDSENRPLRPTFDGTVKRGSATCPCCGYTTPVTRVRDQLKERHGGADDARLCCVVTLPAGGDQRAYRNASSADHEAFQRSLTRLISLKARAESDNLSVVPNERIPFTELRRISVPIYGMTSWGDLFSARQAFAISTLVKLSGSAAKALRSEEGDFYDAVATVIGIAVSRFTDICNALCMWETSKTQVRHLFTRQAIGMLWDYAEPNVLADAAGNFSVTLNTMIEVLQRESIGLQPGHAAQASATAQLMPDASVHAVITDPPYYDAVPYAHLSDFFYVWLRRSLGPIHRDLFLKPEAPKTSEIVVDRPHELSTSTKGIVFYERELTKAFAESRRTLRSDGIATIVFASKTTASWEAVLNAVVEAGWVITGSWPIDTEMANKLAALGQARLMSSVHLVCRPRNSAVDTDDFEQVGDWRDVLQELPRRIHEWMPRLADEGVVGADAIFACLGPALEIFSRYSRVEKANGDTVTLREYLEHVWAAVAREALAQVFKGADATGFEPDARLTAMWLWTLNAPIAGGEAEDSGEVDPDDEEQETKKPKAGGFRLEYDAARKIAQGLGAVLENLTHLIEVKGDEARLLPVTERTRHLFGKDQEEAARPARKRASAQMNMFAELTGAEDAETAWQEKTVTRIGETTLDRVHQAMILFAAGRGDALKRFVVENGVGRDGKFWRLAQALSALYPPGTDERRWVEGLMARKKQFGF
jgi:adenine-specific DNA methylase